MDSPIFMLLIGLLLGVGATWFALMNKCKAAADAATAQANVEIASIKATLQERTARISQLETDLSQRDCEIAAAQAELTGLKSQKTGLEVAIEKERRAADEKLALLTEAEQKLSNTFKALSSD